MVVVRLIAEQKDRLDVILAQALPEFSRTKLAAWINEGKVLVDGTPRRSSFLVFPEMVIDLEMPPPRPPHDLRPAFVPLMFAFEDEFLLVVEKPRGLATHPAASLKEPSLVNALLGLNVQLSESGEDYRPGIVHRLDKETTGLMLIAKTDEVHEALSKAIQLRQVTRKYFALATGIIEQNDFTIDAPILRDAKNRLKMAVGLKGKPARTGVKRIARFHEDTLLALTLATGRTHQIRVHLSSVGHPVIGDNLYLGHSSPYALQLHAGYLKFTHPISGEEHAYYSQPPEDFIAHALCSRAAIE